MFKKLHKSDYQKQFSSVQKKTASGHQPQFLNRTYVPDVAISELL
jgi:hypothetical protein